MVAWIRFLDTDSTYSSPCISLSSDISFLIHTEMVKREHQEIDDGDDTGSITPITRIKKEVVQDSDITISSAIKTPKKRSKSQSSKSTDGGEGPDTPKSKSPAKSVSPISNIDLGSANESDGPHPKMRS
jgi:hypothetical protein